MPTEPTEPCPLSPRQLDCVRLAAEGLTVGQCTTRLYIGEATVRAHRREVNERLGVPSLTAAVAVCLRKGWME